MAASVGRNNCHLCTLAAWFESVEKWGVTWLRNRKWQDLLLSFGGIIFLLGLLPSVLGNNKPAPTTSLSTAIMLCAFLFVYASYKLWMVFCLTVVTAALWFLLYAQVALL